MAEVTELACGDGVIDHQSSRWGRWIYKHLVVVAVLSVGHALAAAYDPNSLPLIDDTLTYLIGALRIFGLHIVTPGLDGPLPHNFYVNQVGIATWGVVASTAMTLFEATQGRLPVIDPERAVDNLIIKKSWSPTRAWVSHRARIFLAVVPLAIFGGLLFFDGVFGWIVFHFQPKDWRMLSIFTLVMVYLSGTLVFPGILIAGRFLQIDIRNLIRYLNFKRD
jgi:hypothetical protein